MPRESKPSKQQPLNCHRQLTVRREHLLKCGVNFIILSHSFTYSYFFLESRSSGKTKVGINGKFIKLELNLFVVCL